MPTPVSRPPSLEWHMHTTQRTHHSKVPSSLNAIEGVSLSDGYAVWCTGAIQGKDGRIQVFAGLAPSSQIVGSLFRVIHEQAKCSL